jgi:uncharacterized protein (TIGR00725 family)
VRKRVVAVIGGGECSVEEACFAEELGRRLAEEGIVVVTGGRGGVMAAVSRGAQQAGGLTIGILPGTHPDESNPYLDVAIPTGMGELRNGLVVAAGEVVVAIGGEYGTLSEIGLALKVEKPVLGWRTWRPRHYRGTDAPIIAVSSVDEAMEQIQQFLEHSIGEEKT